MTPPSRRSLSPDPMLSSDEEDFSTLRNGRTKGKELAHDNDDTQDSSRDYSAHMEDIFSDDDEKETLHVSETRTPSEDSDDDEGFVYTGVDAEPSASGYRAQLEDVLDGEKLSSEDGTDAGHPSTGLLDVESNASVDRQSQSSAGLSQPDESPSPRSAVSPNIIPELIVETENMPSTSKPVEDAPVERRRPFLHPHISRLRSGIPASPRQRLVSSTSFGSVPPDAGDRLLSPSPSHFSALSRRSSASHFHAGPSREREPEAIAWTSLRVAGEQIYKKTPDKANAVLGTPNMGSPTVLAANGMICVGTDAGRVLVFDFKQRLRCICGSEETVKTMGPVTALALSHDHTFVAVGHIRGHIRLFDLSKPDIPARSVNPTNLATVKTGRQEGHLQGSRIVSLGFMSARHTGFVSADDQGLSFYHSLGKVLFIEANDCLRILGKYPDNDADLISSSLRRTDTDGLETPKANGFDSSRKSTRKAGAILAMSPLPLGTTEHPTDIYQLTALLTPIKLVIVGLKPTARTWHRRHRESESGSDSQSRWRGCLSWFPSIEKPDTHAPETTSQAKKKGQASQSGTEPLLAYSWAGILTVAKCTEQKISQKVRNERTGKIERVEVGRIAIVELGVHGSMEDILAIQWLNVNQLVLVYEQMIQVLDVRTCNVVEQVPFDGLRLASPSLSNISSGAVAYQDSVRDIQHSVRTYKGKIFTLGYEELSVGTLLTWADRILYFVGLGDFLSAINLAREYYIGRARGNKNGLPEDEAAMHSVVGEKIRELMLASARYAFSEDRMTDGTHASADNRGVDRTSLFEGLVATCTEASLALGDFDFLLDDLYQFYEDSGIAKIYLQQIEPYVLDGKIPFIPPRITQRLIAMHDDEGDQEGAERLIWHIDPDCLDINQALTLCQKYRLYDALVYIYNTALQDYITPMVELLLLVRELRHSRMMARKSHNGVGFTDEQLTINAYKIFPYLSDILSGLTYPSERPMSSDVGAKAQTDIYSFLFHGTSKAWPSGANGRLILTAEEGGMEPTYPYARLLLTFDAEAFLDVLDLAFEQSYFNEEGCAWSRQLLIKILLDIIASSSSSLSQADVTFVNIFVARNVPKYFQVIHMSPSSLQNLLVGLAADPDQSTKEDRQLAAEFLLSVYKPHDVDRIQGLFEKAGFYNILRSWYTRDRQWLALLETFVHDADMTPGDMFTNVESTLTHLVSDNGFDLPQDARSIILNSGSILLEGGIPQTALLVDKFIPGDHEAILSRLGANADAKRYAYLRCLLGPPPNEDGHVGLTREGGPSEMVGEALRKEYLKLLCRLEPSDIIIGLEYLPRDDLEIEDVVGICEEEGLYEAVIWLLNEESGTEALSKFKSYSQRLSVSFGEAMLRIAQSEDANDDYGELTHKWSALVHMGIDICKDSSEQDAEADAPPEDLWFQLLDGQIEMVQNVSAVLPPENDGEALKASLRSLIQDSFTSLVTVSSTKAVSFPRLFKRLVDSAGQTRARSGTMYAEFRTIITSMLESYRAEGDLLVMSKSIVASDFYETFEKLTKAHARGWAAPSSKCPGCRKWVFTGKKGEIGENENNNSIVVGRGGIFHLACHQQLAASA